MPAALADGEVLVTLSCLAPSTLLFPQRRLLLSSQKSSVPIGRASKRSSTLESRMYNGWVDAPVMSRRHAELRLASQGQTVLIQDVGSLHGTYHNDMKLQEGQAQALKNGDLLKFGIAIDRGNESFPQCTMKVGLEFGQVGDQAAIEASLPPPTVFSVPDETDSEMEDMEDMEDINSQAAFSSLDDDDEDPALGESAGALTHNGLDLAEFHGFDTSDPIDLTSEPDLISEDNIPSSSSPISDESDLPAHNTDCTLGTVELDDVELGTLSEVSAALPSESFTPATQVKEDIRVNIVDENIPGMHGPLSEDQHVSPFPELYSSTLRARSLGERSGKPLYYIPREPNQFQIRYLLNSEDAQPEPVSGPPEEAHVSSNTNELEEAVLKDSTSKKRKADEISDSAPFEARIDDRSLNFSPREAEALPQDVPLNSNATPAYKRVKTAVEYVGLMALGGAAVMTALIATAPNF